MSAKMYSPVFNERTPTRGQDCARCYGRGVTTKSSGRKRCSHLKVTSSASSPSSSSSRSCSSPSSTSSFSSPSSSWLREVLSRYRTPLLSVGSLAYYTCVTDFVFSKGWCPQGQPEM